jgi:hypothetical protein
MHYAFSDGLGFTYFSEKDLNLAVDVRNINAMTELGKVFGTSNNGFDSFGYIHDEASWRDNYWRLVDYFATTTDRDASGKIANFENWNGDGWLIFNFPESKYTGKYLKPKYDGVSAVSYQVPAAKGFAIYSVTDSEDMGSAVVSDIDSFDTNKVTYTFDANS